MSAAEIVLAIVVACVGSNGLWNFLSNRFDKNKVTMKGLKAENKKQWEQIDNLKEMSKATLKDNHMRLCKEILRNGVITESDAENLETIHRAYVLAGLNGWGEKLYNRCMSLPLKKGE